jgi:hypothetical protein
MDIFKGSTDITTYVMMVDSTTGVPETGLTITDFDATYTRMRAAAVKNDLTALGAANSAHADNQGIEVDSTNTPGLYRIDWPDAAFATGADKVILTVTCTGCAPAVREVSLVNVNNQVAYVPNAAADAAGGLPISDAGGLDLDSKLANTNEVTAARMGALTDWINGGRLDLILDIIAADTTTDIPALIAALEAKVDTVDANVDAVLVDTNELQTDWANGGRLDLLIDAIKAVTDAQGGANAVETGVSLLGSQRAILAALAGVATGGSSTSIVLKNPAGDTTRVTLTVDADGNRSASTLNV